MTSPGDPRPALRALSDEMKPLTPEQQAEIYQLSRARRLRACIRFKNYIWGILAVDLMLALVVRIAFGIVNIVSAFEPVSNPQALAIAYTVIAGVLLALFMVIDFLYVTQQIGCKDYDFSPQEVNELSQSKYAYFEPGCFYDCRIVGNRIDINTIRVFLPASFFLSLILFWSGNTSTGTPSKDSPEGVRFLTQHLMLLGIEAIAIYCIVSNLYSFWARRSPLYTLRIHAWFLIERYWEADERPKYPAFLQ